MKILQLAIRNLMRNRRRSITTVMAMIIGMCSILLFGGYSRDITYSLQTGYVQRSGHLQIQHRDYFLYGSGNPSLYGLADYKRIIEVVSNDPDLGSMLTVATPTLQIGGLAGNYAAGVSRTVIGTGVVVKDQNRLRQWNDYGSNRHPKPQPLTDTTEDAAVIGMGVARVLHLCEPLHVPNCFGPSAQPGAKGPKMPSDIAQLARTESQVAVPTGDTYIELLAANAGGAPNVSRLKVVKAEAQGAKELDDVYVSLHLSQAQRLVYGSGEPNATAVVLQLKHTWMMPDAEKRLEQILKINFPDAPLTIQRFETINPFYGQSISMFKAIFSFISILISAVVLFTVGNTMSMAVVERTVEIGTLRAIGLRRSGIRRIFICEGFLLGLIGIVAGLAIAILLALIINHSGLTWLPPGRIDKVPLTVRVWSETAMILTTAGGLIIVAVASALLPAARAAKLNIVDALRHV